MVIELGKKYRTREGQEVRIYAIDGCEPDLVHGAVKQHNGWVITCWLADGRYFDSGKGDSRDLVEVGPYDHIKIGDPVLCWDEPDDEPARRYFAGVSRFGKPLAFIDGCTQWSSKGVTMDWGFCELTEEI